MPTSVSSFPEPSVITPAQSAASFTRRTALQVSGAAAVVGASSVATGMGKAHAEEPLAAPTLVDQFISQPQFVIAHRGAGDVNPEHTAYAYQRAILRGAQAIEISVRTTLDGELVCMHDNALRRTTTSSTGYVSSSTLAELQQVQVDARDFLGSGTPLEKSPP